MKTIKNDHSEKQNVIPFANCFNHVSTRDLEEIMEFFEDAINCEELWSINNGRTLCIDCHKKTNTYLKNYEKNK